MWIKNNNSRPLHKPVIEPISKRFILNTSFVTTTAIGYLLCIIYVIFSVISFRSILVYSIEVDVTLNGVVGARAKVRASASALALALSEAKLY